MHSIETIRALFSTHVHQPRPTRDALFVCIAEEEVWKTNKWPQSLWLLL